MDRTSIENKVRMDAISKSLKMRGWSANNFTLFVIESHMSVGHIAYLMGINRATARYWLHQDKLSDAVNFIFLVARKMRMMGADLFDYC